MYHLIRNVYDRNGNYEWHQQFGSCIYCIKMIAWGSWGGKESMERYSKDLLLICVLFILLVIILQYL
ncbi:hypothetical protein D3C80_1579380 [compost metagenome]